jgi:predicted  nucleic acid-binding Zn-ribbon protein
VQESSRAIQTLTARIDASESAVADAVERVEVMENQVGAAVSASAAVASSAAALEAQHPDTAKLAQERAALEREKAQLRDAAAQLERAASNLERVVPPPRR